MYIIYSPIFGVETSMLSADVIRVLFVVACLAVAFVGDTVHVFFGRDRMVRSFVKPQVHFIMYFEMPFSGIVLEIRAAVEGAIVRKLSRCTPLLCFFYTTLATKYVRTLQF